MKAILISIQPQWVELILNFIKKDEIRKGTAIGKAINKLIEEQGVAPTFIYCTKDKSNKEVLIKMHNRYGMTKNADPYGKVVARFNATAEHIEYETCSRDISGWWKDDGEMYDHKDACLTYKEMFDYIGAGEGTVIHINDIEIFDKPKEISEFYRIVKTDIGYCVDDIEKQKPITLNACKNITKAPESWCYIEI